MPHRLFTCVALSGVLLAVAAALPWGGNPAPRRSRTMAPHPVPDRGTFFEGWYLRLIAPEALSVGALAASWHDMALDRSESYLALFVQQPEASRLDVHDAVLTTRPSIVPSAPRRRAPDPSSPAAFRWELGDDNVVTERSMTIALPDGARFAATLGAPVFWNPADPSEGPEGAWLNSPRLEGHWFVYSTASTVQWSLTSADGRAQSGTGLAHFEKNWGASFPRRWIWAQGIDPRTGTSFVLAGGDNPLVPGMPGGAWMLGVRSPLGAWDYATARGGQELSVWPDGCRGTVTVPRRRPRGTRRDFRRGAARQFRHDQGAAGRRIPAPERDVFPWRRRAAAHPPARWRGRRGNHLQDSLFGAGVRRIVALRDRAARSATPDKANEEIRWAGDRRAGRNSRVRLRREAVRERQE